MTNKELAEEEEKALKEKEEKDLQIGRAACRERV